MALITEAVGREPLMIAYAVNLVLKPIIARLKMPRTTTRANATSRGIGLLFPFEKVEAGCLSRMV